MTGQPSANLVHRRLNEVAGTQWSTQPLPYGIRVEHIQQAMREVYDILDDMSRPLVARGLGRLEDFMLGNSLSGLISELLVQGLAKRTGMKRNVLVGGFPDLLPAYFSGNSVQGATE